MKCAVLVMLLALAGCGWRKPETAGEIYLSGRIEGDEIDIAPKIGGRVVEITVREGDPVRVGQVLVRLAGETQRALLEEAEARLRGARARREQASLQIPVLEQRLAQVRLLERQALQDAPGRVAQAEAQLEAVRADLVRALAEEEQIQADARRYAELAQTGAVTRQLAEQYATRVDTAAATVAGVRKQAAAAEAAVGVARAALENPPIRAAEAGTIERQIAEAQAVLRLVDAEIAAAQAAVARARADVEELEVRAPADATVITRAAEPGRVVAAGATMLTLVDLAQVYLRGFVPEGQIGLVKLGQRAEVYLDSAPNTALPAEVMRVDPQAMFTPENIYFRDDRVRQVVGVKLRLKGGYGQAKPGIPADGKIFVTDSGMKG